MVIGQENDACSNDKNKFCGDKVEFGPTLECLEARKNELSWACRTKMEALRTQIDIYHHVCDNSIAALCPEAPRHENDTALCLMSHFSQLERHCLDYMAGLLVAAFYDTSFKGDITYLFLPGYEDNTTSTMYQETISKVGGPVGAALIAVCLTASFAIIIFLLIYVFSYQAKRKIAMKARLSAAAASLGHPHPVPMDAFLDNGRATSQNYALVKSKEQPSGNLFPIAKGISVPTGSTADSHSRAPESKIPQLDHD